MPFAFNQIQPTTIGTVDKWDIPLNRWLGVKFGAGYDDGLGSALSNFTEDQIYDEGPVMQPDFATKQFGIEGHLKFDVPVSVGKAALLRRRKEAELEKQAYLESASHGWFSAKAFAGFGASMVGGFAHPLDLGTAFIPFVGSSTKAIEATRMGAGPLERAFARGLLTEEGIAAARIPFPRLSASILEGVLSQAAVEIPIGIEKYRSQADYGAEDAATNILGGGLFAGGLHLSAKALKAIWSKTAEFHSRLTPETKDALLREHEAALMDGREPDTARIISVDENAIRERLRFDEVAARREARRAGGTFEFRDMTPEERKAAEEDAIRSGAYDSTYFNEFKKKFGFVENQNYIKSLIKDALENNPELRREYERIHQKDTAKQNAGSHIYDLMNFDESSVGAADLDLIEKIKLTDPDIAIALNTLKDTARATTFAITKLHELGINERVETLLNDWNEIREQVWEQDPELAKFIEIFVFKAREHGPVYDADLTKIREDKISQIIDAKRSEHNAALEGRVSAEVEAERARQIAEGRILPPEVVKAYEFKTNPDDADIAVIAADAETIKKDIINREFDPEKQAALKKELEELREDLYPDESKAVLKSLPCIGKTE